jgi:hypothetical protein
VVLQDRRSEREVLDRLLEAVFASVRACELVVRGEATVEQADHTAKEQEEGGSLEQRPGEEQPSRPPLAIQLAIEEFDAPDEEGR